MGIQRETFNVFEMIFTTEEVYMYRIMYINFRVFNIILKLPNLVCFWGRICAKFRHQDSNNIDKEQEVYLKGVLSTF